MPDGTITYEWRGSFTNDEIHALHSEAFDTRLFNESEWNWVEQVNSHSLGWVVAPTRGPVCRIRQCPFGMALVHAFIEDVMVDGSKRHRGIGVGVVHAARDGAKDAGCEFLHVGFEDDLRAFYIDACGFQPTLGGLIEL